MDRSRGWRGVAAVLAAALFGAPVAAQDAPPAESTAAAPAVALPAPAPPVRDYWPLLAAGIGVVAGGVAGARLAHLEAERWQALPAATADRQRQIDAWTTWTVAGSVAAAVGVGLIVLWGTIRLSQARAAPDRP